MRVPTGMMVGSSLRPLIRPFGPPSPLWGEGKARRGRGPGRPLLALRANSPSRAPRRRSVSARRGGPVCPPPRSGRTYRCAPTGRRGAGAEAKASPRERQRAAEGGGPCGWKRIEIFVGVGLSLTGRPGRVLPGQWRQWPGRPAPDAPPPAPGGGRSWPPAPQRRCRTPP